MQLKAYLKKVYPLKACEIRAFAIVTRGTPLQLTGGKIEMPVEPEEPKDEEPKQEAPVEAQ